MKVETHSHLLSHIAFFHLASLLLHKRLKSQKNFFWLFFFFFGENANPELVLFSITRIKFKQIKEFLKYIIREHNDILDSSVLCKFEYNIHCNNEDEYIYTTYILLILKDIIG